MSILEDIKQYPISDSLEDPIVKSELDQALKNTKIGKSPGPDGMLVEVIVIGGT